MEILRLSSFFEKSDADLMSCAKLQLCALFKRESLKCNLTTETN